MIRILFQGDSITDWGRNYEEYFSLGHGYVKFASDYIREMFPEKEFEFINRGIGGNKVVDLVNRLDSDFIEIQPDFVSILIGINDVWHLAGDRNWLPNDVFEAQYRTVLDAIKEKTNAKIMILEPFVIPVEDKLHFREDLAPKIEIIRKLAREYACVYLPTDGLLNSAFIGDDPLSFAADGVHPTDKGAEFIGRMYAQFAREAISKL